MGPWVHFGRSHKIELQSGCGSPEVKFLIFPGTNTRQGITRRDANTASSQLESPAGANTQGKHPQPPDGLQKVFGVVLNVSETTCDAVSVKENNGNSAQRRANMSDNDG